ncbi:MAG TPA: hypothetical protein VFT64_06335 [Rickettsiales bacterium]|nr:hypothetical protein [Rickettsiales bacterium]
MEKQNTHQYLLEFVALEGSVKVTALEPESGVEASVICPATATRKDMTDLAIRKLHYVLKKKNTSQ